MTSDYAVNDRQQEFDDEVRAWVGSALGAEDEFGSLVRALPGVDPLLVVSALEDLVAGGGPKTSRAMAVRRQVRDEPPTHAVTLERPLPHPLEFYWAYDAGSLDMLLARLGEVTAPGDYVAYLGAPNAFVKGLTRLADRHNVLLDRSVLRTRAMRERSAGGEVRQIDLLASRLPALSARAAIMDPPWYPELMRGFLWSAASLIVVGGIVLASVPPVGTRATASVEVDDLLAWADTGGFEVIERQPGVLRYVSSPFELASHRAAGIGGVPLDWRCGDLVVLRLMRAFEHPRPRVMVNEDAWLPFVVDEVPIWVRDRDGDAGPIEGRLMAPLVVDDVLQSVSRRAPIRAQVDVWSSLNRVWSSSHPTALQALCRALADGADPAVEVEAELGRRLDSDEARQVEDTGAHLRAVVAREREEHGL